MERFDYLVSSEWMSFPSYCRFGVCNYLETMGGLPPGNTFFTGPNPPSSIHIPPPAKSANVIFENRTLTTVFTTILSHLLSTWKTVLQRLLDVGPGFLRFFTSLGVDTTLRSKCFQRNVFFWLLCQLLDNMCPSLFPNWPLYLLPLTEHFDFFTLCCHWQARISHLWAVWLLAC